ncbi:MAG TPA: autotransporter-associated beta strand repeat-containing protein [Candidatus Paceibacterota bacterium]|nr:autotransporter-associated beta strand repeat-containing protein [Candidatus Paceibacterota bacterium]
MKIFVGHAGIALVVFLGLPVRLPVQAQTPPASFTTNLTVGGTTVAVAFQYHPIRSANFGVKVQQPDGSFADYTPGPARTYLGTVTGNPGALACATLLADGNLWAKVSFENGVEWVYFSGPSARAYSRGSTTFGLNYPTSPIVTVAGGAGSNIYAAEIAVDSAYAHFNACGQDLERTVAAVEFSILSGTYFYLRDNGILHRVGKVFIRANYDQDPYHLISSAGGKLDACRVFLSANDTTHDVGTVADSIGGGVAWVGVIGTSVRYSACGYNGGENGDFSQVWRHEVGHNWSCGDWEGGSSEGATIMNGNAYARCSGPEENKIVSHRNGKLGILDNLGPYSFPLPPRASLDTAIAVYPNSVTVDVLHNDHSGNGLPLSLLEVPATSMRGGTVTRSVGTGPGGRDQIVYTPPASSPLGADRFSYRITDSAGRTGLGYVYVMVDPPANDLAGYWPLDEGSGTVAHDASGSANDGTVASAGAWTSAMVGGGLQFNGSTMQVSVPALNLNTNTVTLTGWVKRNGSQSSYAGLIFTRGNGTVAGLNLRGTTHELGYHWNDQYYNFASGLVVPDGQWAFCALVVEPGRAVLYLDDGRGLRAATNNAAHAVQTFGSTLYIGREANDGRFFNGVMDEVRIYRRALSAVEVAQVAAGIGSAYNPVPASGGALFSSLPALQWQNPRTALAQQVFLGTDYAAVANATTNSAEYVGRVSGTQFLPALTDGTWYWRVDEEYGGQVVKGPVWFFSYSSGDPVARWKLDELSGAVARDAIGVNHGTYFNNPTLAQPGVLIEATNRAVRFNGSNQKVDVPYASVLNTTSFTVEVWCKVTGGAGTYRSPLTSRDDSPSRGFVFYAGNNNVWQFWTGNGNAGGWTQMSGPEVVLDQWVQLVGVVHANYQSFYVNGAPYGTAQANFAPNTARPLRIGAGSTETAGAYYFPGLVDDVRVYNRPLSAAEIASRYQQSVNRAPFFAFDPVVLPAASIGVAYSNSLGGVVSDPNPGDTLTFSKVAGPDWLSVAPDGSLSGTPQAGDAGLNTLMVRATDSFNAAATGRVQLSAGGVVWNGGGTSSFWNQPANWSGTTPAGGQDLVFTGLARRGNTNNFLGSAGQVCFLTPGFSIYGNALVLGKGILSQAGPNQWNIPLTLAAPQSVISSNDTLTVGGSVNNNGHNLSIAGAGDTVLAGILSGSGGLIKAGAGSLRLGNAGNTFGGDLTVSEGTVIASALTSSGTASALGAKSGARVITVGPNAMLQFSMNNIFGGGGMSAAGLPALVIHGTLSASRFNVLPNVTLNGGALVQNASDGPGTYEGFQFIGAVAVGGTNASSMSAATGRANHLRGGGTTVFAVADATGDEAPDLVISASLKDGSGDYPGAASLTKDGPGTLLLSGTNTYSGGTLLNGGTLAAQFAGGNAPLSTGGITLAGGTLALFGPTTQTPLGLTGFNHDVLLGASEASAAAGTTRGIDNANYVFYETNAPGSGGAGGLPASRVLNSQANPAVSFLLQPYGGNNALTLASGSGTLTLSSPVTASRLSLLHTSGSGTTTFSLVVNFADGTSQTVGGLSSPDWGTSNAAVAVVVKGRVQRGGSFETGSSWYLFQTDYNVPVGSQMKPIASVTIARTGGSGVLSVFAISATVVNGPVSLVNALNVTGDSTVDLRGTQAAAGAGALSVGGHRLTISGAPTAAFTLEAPLTLNGAATFNIAVSNTTFLGTAGGNGSLTKTGPGRLTLTSPASYAGDTVIHEGTLALTASGSLAASPNLIVAAGATLDAVNGLTVGTSQTLKGSGTITGNTVVLGRLEPGLSLGRLNFSGDLALAGVTELELSKSPLTNDQVSAAGTITFGGTLLLTNLGGTPLAPGDSFTLFNAAQYSGSFAAISPPTPGPGLAWETSALASSGTLSVIATVNPNPTNLSVHVSGDRLTLSWPADHTGWTLQSQTNGLGVGLGDNWVDIPASTTTNQVIVPINPAAPAVFYRLRL